MSAISIQPSYPIFNGLDGRPLEGGFVYIGQANLDPITNPIQIYWDPELTIPAEQPIRLIAGYPTRNGTPAVAYAAVNHSIRVLDKNGGLVYSSPFIQNRYPASVIGGIDASQVAFKQAGAGAVDRTTSEKLREVVSVKDFGAVGDGVNDDTAAIQAAVNATGTSGGTIYFPKGVYKVSSAIQINGRSNVRFVGVGISGSWENSSYGTTIQATSSAIDVFEFTNYSYNCSVEGMQIVGARRAITFTYCLGWYVEKVNLRNNVTGIEAFGNGVGHIKGCWIRKNGTGINMLKSSGDTLIDGNDIGDNNVGVFVGTGTVRIINNSIFYSRNAGAGAGILIDSVDGAITDAVVRATVIAHNLIASNDTQIVIRGIDLASRDVREVRIHHNHIHQADDGGEGFDGGFAYGYGIYIEYADRIHINHNNIIGMRDFGIKAKGALNGVFVDHNVIKSGNGAGVIFDCVQWGRIDNNEFFSNAGTAVQMLCYNAGDWNQNNRITGNSFRSNGAVYTEDARTRANVVLDNLGGTLGDYVVNTSAPVSQIRHIAQAGNQESVKNQSLYVDGAAWNGSKVILGSHNLWVDGAGRLRIKSGAPTSDTDGTVIGTQT